MADSPSPEQAPRAKPGAVIELGQLPPTSQERHEAGLISRRELREWSEMEKLFRRGHRTAGRDWLTESDVRVLVAGSRVSRPRARGAGRPRAAARASSRGGDSGDPDSAEGDGDPPPPDPHHHLEHGPGVAGRCEHPLVWVHGELVCAIVGCPERPERVAR
jgi:hypothetical protein